MNRALWLLLAGLIAALGIPLLLGGWGVFAQLRGFPPGQLLLMFGVVLACWNLNALRLRLLLAGRAGRIGQRHAAGIVAATEFAVCVTPSGSGGPLTLLALLAKAGLRPAQASGVFAADQLLDLLFFLSALVGLALYVFTAAIELQIGWLIGPPMLLLLTGLAVFGLTLRNYAWLLRISGRWLRWFRLHRRTGFGLARRLLHFRNALLLTLQLPRRVLLLAFVLATANWLLRYSLLYLAITGLGFEIDWAWAFLIQMLSMLAGHLTFVPGGAGGTELTSTALLIPLLGAETAAAAVLTWRFAAFYFPLLAGAPIFMNMVGHSLIGFLKTRDPT